MNSLTDANLKSLKWEQSGKLASRLVADGQTIATLSWAKSWGSLATGESAEGEWTFKRIGFLRPRVTVRETGSDADLAVFSISWTGDGTVVFSCRDLSVQKVRFLASRMVNVRFEGC
jgi:hypothetical protein